MSETNGGWRRWMRDYNEGLGLVYERLVLNDYLDHLVDEYGVRSVLEVPVYGMAGVTGINSVRFAQRGVPVTLVDVNEARLAEIRRVWRELGLEHLAAFVLVPDLVNLPFPACTFDFVWNWAALWYPPNATGLLQEMARVTGRLVFTAMPNRLQMGYLLRKFLLERDFFNGVEERWAAIGEAREVLAACGMQLVEQGVLDVPPWPDTVMPAAEVLKRLGLGATSLAERFGNSESWAWSTMDYYTGRRPELKAQMDRYAVLERVPIPWQVKVVWAHHRYILMSREGRSSESEDTPECQPLNPR